MKRLILFIFTIQLMGCSTQPNETNRETENADPFTQDSVKQDDSGQVEESSKTEEENWNAYYRSMDINNYVVTESNGHTPTVIEQDAIVFVSPDSLEVQEMIKELGDDFYTVADDNNYYKYEADQFMTQNGVKSVYPKTRYLKFIQADSKTLLIDTKSSASRGWTTILFQPDSLPKVINPVDIREEFEKYFNRKAAANNR
ncbi:hypothetical protein FHS59_002289 [Algoriphagus iocasae]|uniref:Uncharacterized protein n=1 Tax=Algoriphagus iocasae TaxID=1836499 RepID=A0A841MXC4_9BACT|nr:hypothetical protein [Algoriphagus iocasae]MBB6326661.1 hypothetical protein [Algoriphagus iocasae]